jgi:hypothetical protein
VRLGTRASLPVEVPHFDRFQWDHLGALPEDGEYCEPDGADLDDPDDPDGDDEIGNVRTYSDGTFYQCAVCGDELTGDEIDALEPEELDHCFECHPIAKKEHREFPVIALAHPKFGRGLLKEIRVDGKITVQYPEPNGVKTFQFPLATQFLTYSSGKQATYAGLKAKVAKRWWAAALSGSQQ